MIEDGIKISELTTTSTINNEDLIPIVQGEETKSITREDLFSSNDVKGDVYQYNNITGISNISANQWKIGLANTTTSNLPIGTYLIVFTATFSLASSVTGSHIASIRPVIDGTYDNVKRSTIPMLASLTSTAQVIRLFRPNQEGTHTLNIEVYCDSTISSTGGAISIIRLK